MNEMIPRLYLDAPLADGAAAALGRPHTHYLRNVLRREAGAELRVFNARDGEFSAVLVDIGKSSALVEIGEQKRAPAQEPDIHLIVALIKRAPLEVIIQKGVELGVMKFIPVVTDRTNADKIRVDRLSAIAQEAAEQCERLSVPDIENIDRLPELLLKWDKSRVLFYCDESGDNSTENWGGNSGRAAPLFEAAKAVAAKKAAILIGPEGGFSQDERAWLKAIPFVHAVSLGPRILRADTAAVVALALWQAAMGDLGHVEVAQK